jgi:hypothetical protein
VECEALQRLSYIFDLTIIHKDIMSSTLHKCPARRPDRVIVLPFHSCHDGTMLACVGRAYHHVNVRMLQSEASEERRRAGAHCIERGHGGIVHDPVWHVKVHVYCMYLYGAHHRDISMMSLWKYASVRPPLSFIHKMILSKSVLRYRPFSRISKK